MPARKHTQWLAKPSVDYVDSRIYSDQDIFDEEIEKIFKKVWIPLCHESEIPNELTIVIHLLPVNRFLWSRGKKTLMRSNMITIWVYRVHWMEVQKKSLLDAKNYIVKSNMVAWYG